VNDYVEGDARQPEQQSISHTSLGYLVDSSLRVCLRIDLGAIIGS